VKLNGLDFAGMFLWLSTSLGKVSESRKDEQVPLLLPTGWTSITS
jgi:uncharacterized protein YegL